MEAKLTLENIGTAVEEVESFYDGAAVNGTSAKKVALGVEETLLRFRDEFGEAQDFTLRTGKNFGKLKVLIEVEERMYDPYAKNEDAEDESVMMRSALATMGVLPVWRYSRGTNVISYVIKKKSIPEWTNLLIAIALAVVFGLLCRQAPENIVSFINDDLFSPLLDTFMNLLSAIASPMIFFALVWGIYSIGDASTFNVLGKKMAIRDFLYIAGLTIVVGLISMLFFNFESGGTVGVSGFKDLFEVIIGIVPNNIFTPFAEGNTLQILFLGIVIGIAMIMIGEKTQTVALIAEQLNYLVQIIMDFISRLVPFFVFGSLFDLIISNDIAQVKSSYKLLFVNLIPCLLMLVFYAVNVAVRLRVDIRTYVKKFLPTFIIGLTTASSAAAFSENMNTCISKYGVKQNLANFGVPFNQVVYKPTVSILYFTMAIYTAEVFAVPTSISWFASAFFMSIILGVATPPIPGGTLASISVLFAQLHLPMDGMALVMALNVLLDFIETPTDLIGGQTMLILSANRFKLIDKEVLRSK